MIAVDKLSMLVVHLKHHIESGILHISEGVRRNVDGIDRSGKGDSLSIMKKEVKTYRIGIGKGTWKRETLKIMERVGESDVVIRKRSGVSVGVIFECITSEELPMNGAVDVREIDG